MHQIIFIQGASGLGKSTLAKNLHKHYKGVYIEQYMIPDFVTKDGKTQITGAEEDETLYRLMVANIKEFVSLGYKNVIALDFNPVRFRDIPNDFLGYDYLIIKLDCDSFEQNWKQMKNREKGGLVDEKLLREEYLIKQKFPEPQLPNQIVINITNKTSKEVFKEAVKIIDSTKANLNYKYVMPDKRCYSTWVLADKINLED